MANTEVRLANIELEDVKLRYPNFSGKIDQFNKDGKQNFQILLDEADAMAMLADGWNVKTIDPRMEGDLPKYSLKIEVSDKIFLPRMVLITSRGRTNLDMKTCQTLDFVEVEHVDVIINPSKWGPINGKEGIKAYLKSIYVTIKEDRFERKYAEMEETRAKTFNNQPDSEWER